MCGEHVNDAVGLLKKYGSEAKWLSGGMSLIPLMKLRLAGPTHLIDLYRWRHLLLQAAHSHRSAGVTHAAVGAIDILLRGVGQVMFQNNPITGLLFLVGIFINSYECGLTALLGVVVATFAAYLLGADRTLIRLSQPEGQGTGKVNKNSARNQKVSTTFGFEPQCIIWPSAAIRGGGCGGKVRLSCSNSSLWSVVGSV